MNLKGIKRLEELHAWQEANYPLRMSEKARVMGLSDQEFKSELDGLAADYHKKRYGG